MADILSLTGSLSVIPAIGFPSGQTALETPLCQSLALTQQFNNTYTLSSDSPMSVPFGGLSSAAFIFMKVTGGEVTVELTSPVGTDQALGVDSLLVMIDQTNPYTAMTITRSPGIVSNVNIILGQTS